MIFDSVVVALLETFGTSPDGTTKLVGRGERNRTTGTGIQLCVKARRGRRRSMATHRSSSSSSSSTDVVCGGLPNCLLGLFGAAGRHSFKRLWTTQDPCASCLRKRPNRSIGSLRCHASRSLNY